MSTSAIRRSQSQTLQHEELLLSFPLYCWSPAREKDEYITEIQILFPVLLSRAEGCLKPEVSTIRKACALISGQQCPHVQRNLKKNFHFQTLIISNKVNLASMSLKHIHMWFLFCLNLSRLGNTIHGRQSFDSRAALQPHLKSLF